MKPEILFTLLTFFIFTIFQETMAQTKNRESNSDRIFSELAGHSFHPLNGENSMTIDKNLNTDGIADLDNNDWEIRLLAVRDLVRAGTDETDGIIKGLRHSSLHVRQVSAKALGILRATEAISDLEKVVENDNIAIVRSQAAIALGQMEAQQSLALLQKIMKDDPSRDVRHQCELAIYQIKNKMGVTTKNLEAWKSLDETTFETVKTADVAPDFQLEDTEGNSWQLSQFKNKNWVALIWVFADWCPVCHGEFHDLMEMKDDFEDAGVQVFTLEMHDTFRGRVMVGKELEPDYWFTDEPFNEAYTNRIWWPHLLDRAGAYGAIFGTDPLAFSVHAEYINRPTTVIVDPNGQVRFIYHGTFWGDRPTVEQTLDMIKHETFEFRHQKRL